MNLYRFEVTIDDDPVHVVIVADSDEKAFQLVDVGLEKHFLKMPDVDDISLYEKKKLKNGAGFVLSQFETILQGKAGSKNGESISSRSRSRRSRFNNDKRIEMHPGS
ncbi:DUF3906 family protein [Peribacillus muralis]|uniref:DUF3906 family protein n=1 Tax=Peribacillus muralis TaxID=264697 RepID=UPI003D016095